MLTALLVEDDVRLADLTAAYLEKNQVSVTVARTGTDGLALARSHTFSVLLLDLMLPGIDGLALCRAARQHSDVPIIMLTARGEEADRVLGLESGADDYLPKPFSPRELLARIRAVTRRARGDLVPRKDRLVVGGLALDPAAQTATLDDLLLDLTSYEFSLLHALARRVGQVLSREQLMDLARGNVEDAFDRSIDVHISRLRNKLGDTPKQPRFIKTIRGVGYQLLTQ